MSTPENSILHTEYEGSNFVTQTIEAPLVDEDYRHRPEISLDFGHLGSNLIPAIEKLNEPYCYLPDTIETSLTDLQQTCIYPLLQEKIRRGQSPLLIAEQIAERKDGLNPTIMPIDSYLSLTLSVYRQKLTVQREMAKLLSVSEQHEILSPQDIEYGLSLLARSREVEPYFFAISQTMKDFIGHGINFIENKYQLYEEDELLLSTPAQTSFYTHFLLDTKEYIAAEECDSKTHRTALRNRYFNDSSACTEYALATLDQKREQQTLSQQETARQQITQARTEARNWWLRKFYYLQDRKLPHAAEIDSLLMIDNSVDKFLQQKNCFMHDVFLEIRLREARAGIWQPWVLATLPQQITTTLEQPLRT